jgi:hypothetical protein
MTASQSYAANPDLRSVRQSFSSLVDAMRCLRRSRELDNDIEEARTLAKSKMASLDARIVEISRSIDGLKESLGEARAQELSKKILGFSTTAFDQMKEKINEETEKQVQQLIADSKSEKTKTIRNLEAFLATSPFSFLDRSVEVEKKEAAYGATASYRCPADIEYQFSLDTKASPFFRGQFRITQLDRSLRVPIGLGKSWLRKDPVPDFEDLDSYVVQKSNATDTSLIAEFVDLEKNSDLKGVYTRQGTHTSLTLHYSNGNKSVDISADPSLNAQLDSEAFVRVMEKLWLATNDLEGRKISLTRLYCDGKDVLEGLECDDFIKKSWLVIAPRIKDALKANSSVESKMKLLGEPFDERIVREKLRSLGDDGQEIAASLELAAPAP